MTTLASGVTNHGTGAGGPRGPLTSRPGADHIVRARKRPGPDRQSPAAAAPRPHPEVRPRSLAAALPVLAVLMVAVSGCVTAGSTTTEGPATSSTPDTTATPHPSDCSGRGQLSTRTVRYRDDVGGVDPNLLSLDLSIPEVASGCGPVPLVVYVHGGAFNKGDKAYRIGDKRRLFTGGGWAFASVNYRLSPSPPNGEPDRVQHPTHVQDVAAAVGWLSDEGPALGIDATRIALMGHSAGAYLVALAATDLGYLDAAGVDSSQVRCAVPLDTRYDPEAEAEDSPRTEVMYRNALGDDPSTWDAAAPLHLVRPKAGTPGFLIVTRGAPSRVGASEDFAAALRGVRVPVVEVLNANPLDHEGVNAAIGAPGETAVTPVVMDFLRDCLAPERRRPKG